MGTKTFPARESVVLTALSQVGETEHPPNSNQTKYGEAYGWQGVPWCGEFVWWVFWANGLDLRTLGIPDSHYTPALFVEAQRAGWARIAPEDVQRGDVLFYDFVPPFGTEGIQHTGIAVQAPSNGQIHTIEGNTSSGVEGSQDNGGLVAARTRNLVTVVGAVRPPYGPEGSARTPVLLPKPKKPTRILKLGDVGADVKALQTMLNRRMSDKPKLVTDGVLGPRSVVRVLVYQHRHFLTVDGEAGPKTVYSLWS